MAFVGVIAIINIRNSLNKNCVLAPNGSKTFTKLFSSI